MGVKQIVMFEFEEPDEVVEPQTSGLDAVAKGCVGELTFEIVCHKKGWEVAKCLLPISSYDYVLKVDCEWKTVQVKTVYQHRGMQGGKLVVERLVRLFRGGRHRLGAGVERKYQSGDWDYLFATTGDEHWLIPFEDIDIEWTLRVDRKKYRRYKVEL